MRIVQRFQNSMRVAVSRAPFRLSTAWLLLACLAIAVAALSQSAPKKEVAFETADGDRFTLSQLRGRVAVVIISGKSSGDAGMALMQGVTSAALKEENIVYVLVADLRSAPGLFRGQIRSKVRKRLGEQRTASEEALRLKGVSIDPRRRPIVLLDWHGSMAKQYAVKGNFDAAYHVLVLNAAGQPVFQADQPDQTTAQPPTEAIVRAIKEAENAPGN